LCWHWWPPTIVIPEQKDGKPKKGKGSVTALRIPVDMMGVVVDVLVIMVTLALTTDDV